MSQNSEEPLPKIKKHTKHELQLQLLAMNEFIKIKVAVEVVDVNSGANILPRTFVGAQYNNPISDALIYIEHLPRRKGEKNV